MNMKRLTVFALAAFLWCASFAFAQTARPLSDVLEDWQGYSWNDIRDIAAWEAQNDGPLYPSAPANTPHYESFEGDFTPADSNTKLAIFSDDGCDVFIDGVKVHSAKGRGQALPNLAQSLYQINYSFQEGQTYRIRVDYSNTVYLGAADIDGASLFAYSGEGLVGPTPTPRAPQPTPTPAPTATPEPCSVSLQADAVDSKSVDLSWNQCYQPDFVSYKLFRSETEGFTPDETTYMDRGTDESIASEVTYTNSVLQADTTYHYVLQINHGGKTTEARASVRTNEEGSPSVKFAGLARACAGGIMGDDVHSFTLTATATNPDGSLATNTDFMLSFHNDTGSSPSKKAKFVSQNAEQATILSEGLAVRSDNLGKFSVTVLSSDIASTSTQIKVQWQDSQGQNKTVGSQSCVFDRAWSLRRFGLVNFPNEEDTGWIFNQDVLLSADVTPAKVYLKYRVDPSIPRDTSYFHSDGTPKNGTELSDRGNWKEVNNHALRIRIAEIRLHDSVSYSGSPEDYATLIDSNGDSISEANVTTSNGAAQVNIKAGPLFEQVKLVVLQYTDETQK